MTNETFNENVNDVKEKPSLIGMIMSPREQFERIRSNPKILVPLIVVIVLSMIGALLMLQNMDLMLEEEFPGISEEEMMIFTVGTQIATVITSLFAPIVIILIVSAIFLLIAKIAQSDVTFKQLFSMYTYINFITAIASILHGLVAAFVTGGIEGPVFTSLNAIVNAEGGLGVLLSAIEIFNIWTIILTAIGLQVVAKFSKGLAWGIVIALNVIIIVIGMIAASAGQLLGV